jgi:ParB-like chromosome segregation protein Spo0J
MNLRIEDIKPAPNNAKEHTDKQLKKIAASIAELGFDQPVVVDKNGVIIIGHARYLAATADGANILMIPRS